MQLKEVPLACPQGSLTGSLASSHWLQTLTATMGSPALLGQSVPMIQNGQLKLMDAKYP
jgi:hypothetical protein